MRDEAALRVGSASSRRSQQDAVAPGCQGEDCRRMWRRGQHPPRGYRRYRSTDVSQAPKGRLYCIDSKLRLPYHIEGFVFTFSGTGEYGRTVLLNGHSYRAGVVNTVMSSTVPNNGDEVLCPRLGAKNNRKRRITCSCTLLFSAPKRKDQEGVAGATVDHQSWRLSFSGRGDG